MSKLDELEFLEPSDRRAWGSWLAENHDRSPGVWLAVGKKGNTATRLLYEDAVLEALRYGWIDSTVRRLDEHRTKQLYTPRKPGGTWARSNKERVALLEEQGLIEPAGRAVIERAKADGSWDLLDEVERLVMPQELAAPFAAAPDAADTYERLPDSEKKRLLWWLRSAKREATRRSRLDAALQSLAQGRSPLD